MSSNNRITARFEDLARRKECGLICYIVAGYPDIDTTHDEIDALVKGGIDMLEIGIPFSDPIADGPTIQAASYTALEKGITPQKALNLSKAIRKRHPQLPLMIMTYCNILVRMGIENFMISAKEHGIDGLILPDLSIEEAQPYVSAASKLDLCLVFLVSPNTSETRLRMITEYASGFLYIVSVYGITGSRKTFEDYTLNTIKKVKQIAASKVPIAVGFGISTPDHVKLMRNAGSDAIIIGSAIIDKISRTCSNRKKMINELHGFASSMKKACM